jgi:hypothetical protein
MAPGGLSEPALASKKAEPKNANLVRMITADDLAKLKQQLHQDVNSNEPFIANILRRADFRTACARNQASM